MKLFVSNLLALALITCVFASPLQVAEPVDRHYNDPKIEAWENFLHFDDWEPMLQISSKERRSRNVRFPATVTFTANDEVWLYVNEVEEEHISNPTAVKRVSVEVMRGDVIAIKARSNTQFRGIKVNVQYQGKNHPSSSSKHGSWKAQKAVGSLTYWMSKKYSSCKWRYPVGSDSVTMANGFPSDTGAEYVWSNLAGLGAENTIWMRHVIGDEDCDHQTPQPQPRKRLILCDLRKVSCARLWGLLPSPTPVAGGSPGGLSGREDDECRCRRVEGPVGKCYKMYSPRSRFGRCEAYICGPSYECVENSGEELPKCARRVARKRVMPHRIFRRYCESKDMTPKTYYVLSEK